MPFHDELTIEKIDRIASLETPVLRNVLITQCYCELSVTFAKTMGPGANWCTFATWASKQAGQTIRHEDLQRTLENFLKNEPEIEAALSLVATLAKQSGAQQSFEQLRKSTIGAVVVNAASRAADAVSRGNKKVFEEIAREFSRFITTCLSDTAYDKSHIDNFCQQLKAGLPPDGQEYLAKGFISYYQALFEQDLKKKIQLNLLANLFIGYHEQNRLQPEIAEALNSSMDEQQIKSELLSRLFSGATWWTKLRLFIKRIFGTTLLDKAIEALVHLIQGRVRMALTTHLMTLTLPPDNTLHLGRDLSIPYSTDLAELTNADLIALLALVDPTPNTVLESGATDWANLFERMHYIADMFRCYHQSEELFVAAFTTAQIEAMKSGTLPGGRL
ncbi:MAG: hypothetical protein ABIN01_05340 [Ferruginibacter sp.]